MKHRKMGYKFELQRAQINPLVEHFLQLICHWSAGGLKYSCHCNSGQSVKLFIVMNLQQVDLCSHLLGAGAHWGHISGACNIAKQVGLFLCKIVVVSSPSDMLSGRWRVWCLVWGFDSPLQSCHPHTFRRWIYINMKDKFLEQAAITLKHIPAQVVQFRLLLFAPRCLYFLKQTSHSWNWVAENEHPYLWCHPRRWCVSEMFVWA